MKALFVGKDVNTDGRLNALKALGADTAVISAMDVASIATAKADCAVLSADCAANMPAIAKACREAGLAVFMAQPFAASEADEKAVVDGFSGYDKAVVVGHPAHFVGVYRDLRKMIAAGTLGTLGTIRLGRLRARCAGPQPMAVGMLAVLEWMFGPVEHLYAQSAGSSVDFTIVVARMKSGAIAHLEFGHSELEPYHYYEVTGTGGLVEFDSRYEPEIRISNFADKTIKSAELLPQVLWNEEMAAFVAAIKGEANDLVTLDGGKRALVLSRACAESAKDNKVVLV